MAGSSNITGDESIIFCDNMSFDGTERGGKMTTDGQLWIGSSASPHVKLGTIASQTGLFTVGYSNPNILFNVNSSYISVLATGLQLQGNNTNTAPPAGFIGEQIRNYASGVGLTLGIGGNITSINLTPGIWDVSAIGSVSFSTGGVAIQMGISSTSATITGNNADQGVILNFNPTSAVVLSTSIPSFRISLSTTTTYFLVMVPTAGGGTATAAGRISGTRVG